MESHDQLGRTHQEERLKDCRRDMSSRSSCWLNQYCPPLRHRPCVPIALPLPYSLPENASMHVRSCSEQVNLQHQTVTAEHLCSYFTIIHYEWIAIKLVAIISYCLWSNCNFKISQSTPSNSPIFISYTHSCQRFHFLQEELSNCMTRSVHIYTHLFITRF